MTYSYKYPWVSQKLSDPYVNLINSLSYDTLVFSI